MAAACQLASRKAAAAKVAPAPETAVAGQFAAGHVMGAAAMPNPGMSRPVVRSPMVGGVVVGGSGAGGAAGGVVRGVTLGRMRGPAEPATGRMVFGFVGNFSFGRGLVMDRSCLLGMDFRREDGSRRKQSQSGKRAHEDAEHSKDVYRCATLHCPHSLLYDESLSGFAYRPGKLWVLPKWIRGGRPKAG